MKKEFKWLIWLFLSVLFTFLFYRESIGLNLWIFNLVFLLFMVQVHTIIWTYSLRILISGFIISSAAVLIINSNLSIWVCLISAILLVGFLLAHNSSILLNALDGLSSILTAPLLNVHALLKRKFFVGESTYRTSTRIRFMKLKNVLVPAVGALVFLHFYRIANPLFGNILQGLQFPYKTEELLAFFSVGAFSIFGCVYSTPLSTLLGINVSLDEDILRKKQSTHKQVFHPIQLKYELNTGVWLLILLNAILLIFNFIDILYMEGVAFESFSHSRYVHQGVNTLILSIILAIGIIVYYLRGSLNFYTNNALLLALIYLWLVQNMLLAIGIIYKNYLYVHDFGLTHKRIGVFVYAILVISGLVSTFLKVRWRKNHWFLLRSNLWSAYFILVVMSILNWDSIIADFNLKKRGEVDYHYILGLSDAVLPSLMEEHEKGMFTDEALISGVREKKERFESRTFNQGWKSWNYSDVKIMNSLKK